VSSPPHHRELGHGLLELLVRDRVALSRRQAEADRVIAASGAGHLVHELNVRRGEDRGRPWRIDPVPIVLSGPTFDALSDAVVERVCALELILGDLYGPRQLVRDGVVPGEALSSTPRYRVASIGTHAPPRWLTTYAVDVIALADGSWRVVQDLTDAPTGIGYALLDRSAMLRVADEILGPERSEEIATIIGFPAELRHALVTTTAESSPRIVLYSGGVDHPGYVEHSALARTLGFTMVERPDLVVRQGRLWLRSLGAGAPGLDPIDVVYRRVEDDRVDPIETGAPGSEGVPGLLSAVDDGGVVLANAHGSGLLEDRDLASWWAAAAEVQGGAALRLRTLDGDADRVGLAAWPVFRGGEVAEAPVVVRLHAVAGPDGVSVMPGGNGRVLAPGDDPRHPTARRAKDVWVVGSHGALPVIVAPPLPQVDLAASVPTRAAVALFWAGRAAERAEAIARTVRVVAGRRRQDPGLVVFDGGRWAQRVIAALRVVRGGDELADRDGEGDGVPAPLGPFSALDAELAAATRALVAKLREFVGEAATVGEFLSSNTARSLNAIVQLLDSLGDSSAAIDAIDDVLAALAAYMGMWNESTVRGPAWRFGDIGLRAERALVALELIAACAAPGDDPDDVAASSALEVLLAANESLVAYRRQYRSDVELRATLDLLLSDRDNPRAFGSCVDRIGEHVRDVEWTGGAAWVETLGQFAAEIDDDDKMFEQLGAARDAVEAFCAALVDAWFATPVKPTLVGAART
jgi:uncharacterized circularly permuted ATP-grasp superfamily protein/uncharacterized alpha-E superfamily protein